MPPHRWPGRCALIATLRDNDEELARQTVEKASNSSLQSGSSARHRPPALRHYRFAGGPPSSVGPSNGIRPLWRRASTWPGICFDLAMKRELGRSPRKWLRPIPSTSSPSTT